MTTSPKTLAKLVRWRSFQERQASSDHQTAAAQCQRAAVTRDVAGERALALSADRSEMLGAGQIDLHRLDLLCGLERRAWAQAEQAEAEHAEAVAARDVALAAHVGRRAELNAADAAHTRAASEQRRAQEKVEFDRLAELVTGASR